MSSYVEGCSPRLRTNLSLLLRQLKSLDDILVAYGEEVEALAMTPRYREPVKALTCYKGITHLFALTMITEIGDVKRFAHPQKFVSWIGMDIREYASGGKSNRFGITRQGNRYLRTAFIEANQRGYRTARLTTGDSPRCCWATKTRARTPSSSTAPRSGRISRRYPLRFPIRSTSDT